MNFGIYGTNSAATEPPFTVDAMMKAVEAMRAIPVDPDPVVLVLVGPDEFEELKRQTKPDDEPLPFGLVAATGIPVHVIKGFRGAREIHRSQMKGLRYHDFLDVLCKCLEGGGMTLVNAILDKARAQA